MGAIDALETSVSVVKRNPIIVLVGLVTSIVLAGLGVIPLVGALANVLLAPFVVGGMLGMANSALDGSTGVDDFVESGKRNYASVLGATLLIMGLFVAMSMLFIVPIVFGSFTMGMSSGGTDGGLFAGFGLFMALLSLLGILAYLIAAFVVQFVTVSIVVSSASAVESFTHSYRFVRENVVSVLGYMVLRALVGLLMFVPFVLALAALIGGFDSSVGTALFVVFAVLGLAAVAISTALLPTFHAAYYRDRMPRSSVEPTLSE